MNKPKKEICSIAKTVILTQKNYKTVLKLYEVVCVCCYNDWNPGGKCRDFGFEFDKAANIISNLYTKSSGHKGKVVFAKLNCSQEQMIANEFNVKSSPTYLIIKNEKLLNVQFGNKPETAEYFLRFAERYIIGKKRFRERVPATVSAVKPVNILTELVTLDNYEETIKQYPFVFMMFYANWCYASQDTLQSFERTAIEVTKYYNTKRRYKKNSLIKFVRLDVTDNKKAVKKFAIRYYPTFKLVRHGIIGPNYENRGVWGFPNVMHDMVDFIKKCITKDEDAMREKQKEAMASSALISD